MCERCFHGVKKCGIASCCPADAARVGFHGSDALVLGLKVVPASGFRVVPQGSGSSLPRGPGSSLGVQGCPCLRVPMGVPRGPVSSLPHSSGSRCASTSADAGTTMKYDCMACLKRRMYCLGEMMVGSFPFPPSMPLLLTHVSIFLSQVY